MTQFKSKAGAGRNAQESAVLGLYSYPVLQAADVLLYQGTEVRDGDQARDIHPTHTHLDTRSSGRARRSLQFEYLALGCLCFHPSKRRLPGTCAD